MKRKDAAPLSSILDAFLESLRIPHVAFLVSLRKRWPEIAGPAVSRNATPLSLRNGVLTIVVRNHAWAQELRMSKTTIIGRIRETLGERIPVNDVRFAVGSLAPVEEAEGPAGRGARVPRRSRSGRIVRRGRPGDAGKPARPPPPFEPPEGNSFQAATREVSRYPARKRRQIRSTSGQYFSGPP